MTSSTNNNKDIASSSKDDKDFADLTPTLTCEREPIHIVNRIQPCGTLLVVDSNLIIVQCSTNAVELLPDDETAAVGVANDNNINSSENEKGGIDDLDPRLTVSKINNNNNNINYNLLNKIIGSPLSTLLQSDAVDQVRGVILGANTRPVHTKENTNNNTTHGAVRTFLIRTRGVLSNTGRKSCGVTQSGQHFLIEIEDVDDATVEGGDDKDTSKGNTTTDGGENNQDDAKGESDAMIFMQSIAHDLRKCWSIEEMAGLVCSRIMSETPYDRGMVYRFDESDGSGEVIYETTRWDARRCCRDDSFLGLRFPAGDIPRMARELFMKNTLRFVYDVQGTDHPLYPSRINNSSSMSSGDGERKYTDLSMCRLRGSSHVHLEYLRNMNVTSSLVIAIIVNKKLWGLYSFHGYRHPIRPSARTRFLCEMASVMTSMVMESLTRTNDAARLIDIDQSLCNLQEMSIIDYMETPSLRKKLMDLLDVNLIAFRMTDDDGNVRIRTYCDNEGGGGSVSSSKKDQKQVVDVSPEVFDSLCDTYGQVARDYGIVFIDETNNPALRSIHHTIAFFQCPGGGDKNGLDVLLSRKAMVELIQWGGNPEKNLESDGTLSPRSSFSSFVRGHLKKGKPWDESDRQRVRRFGEKLEKYRSTEVFQKQNLTIQTLGQEHKELIADQKSNLDFFAFMAHELRTPFHGVLGSLEAMKEDPTISNNHLLNQAYMCGKNMIRILDDM